MLLVLTGLCPYSLFLLPIVENALMSVVELDECLVGVGVSGFVGGIPVAFYVSDVK